MLPLMSCIGCLVLATSVAKTSKKYRAFILKLKNQGMYEKWAHQHKDLVLLEKILPYFAASVILLALIGFGIVFASLPESVVLTLGVLGFLYWPLALIFLITISNLCTKIPELQS